MTVLIPAYQPDQRMTALLRELRETCGHRILIVDDGSGPDYAPLFEEAEAMGCTVLRQDVNQGKGAALKRGFAHLAGSDEAEGVVCADCDGQHVAPDILKLAELALQNPGVMVLGKRDFSGGAGSTGGAGGAGGVPVRSLIGNTATRIAFSLIVGVRVYDANTGLRAYRADMLEDLTHIPGDRFEYEMNLLTHSRRFGYRVMEVPITTVYERGGHTSHFRTVQDAARVGAALALFALSSLAAFLLDFAMYGAILHFVFGYSLWARQSADLFTAGELLWAVLAARAASGTLNYALNRRLVFGRGTRHSLLKYIVLAVVMLAANYGAQYFLIKAYAWPAMPTKLITEAFLFLSSFAVQREFVFRRSHKTRGNPL